ncbi:SPOR domain-containing protein [Halpernia sp.]|uniref:SPOR domain-containing protein n=1 Tax=Halpernia sp. TaxID=2782209 RepID=UPI003A959613
MKSFTQIIFFLALFCFSGVSAQLVVKTDTLAGNTVTISMGQKINDLLNTVEDKCSRIAKNSDSSTEDSTTPKINIPERNMSRAEICRKNPRIMGFKILIATVKSNEESKEVGLYFRRRFPSMKVEIDASLRPNYKVMAGSYVSKESANADFRNVKKTFEDARLIPYRVFCVEAK